ncbi:MAG: GNAT family N-acetyltransferase [Bacillota bacterium]
MVDYDPFPIIESRSLMLRRITQEDAEDIFKMRNDPQMHEFTDTKPDTDIEESRAYIDKMNKGIDEDKWIVWAIEHKPSGKVIGTISVWNIDIEQKSAELGYGIIPAYQGKGFMKEALGSIIDYGFNVMKLAALEAYTELSNLKSIRLLTACGFREVEKVDEKGYNNDKVFHMAVFRLENT